MNYAHSLITSLNTSIFGFFDLNETFRGTALELFWQSGLMGKSVIILLLLISIFCWAIILERMITFSRSYREGLKFEQIFKEMRNLNEVGTHISNLKRTPLVKLFIAGYNDFKIRQKYIMGFSRDYDNSPTTDVARSNDIRISEEIDGISRSLEKVSAVEITKLEKRLIFLATAGSVSPFIGLFGTVWGIMNSFRGIGTQSSASFAVIATGISEALIATAAGLATAIPAVIAYNYFISRIKVFITQMEAFSWDFLNIVDRWLKKKSVT